MQETAQTRKFIRKPITCDDCKQEAPDGTLVSYLEWKQVGNYLTPDKRVVKLVCENDLDNYNFND